MNAIDTNVLVYFVDVDEPGKRAKAMALLEQLDERPLEVVLPWQVAAEFLCCLRRWEREGRIVRDDIMRHIGQMESMFTIVFPIRNVLSVSLDLSQRHSLSHWDSMLLAACMEAGVDTLYSEDLTADAVYDSVKILNPFQ